MPNFIKNLGLGFIYDEEEITTNFFGHLIQNGKVINGYYGWPNLFNSKGDIDFYVKTKKNDEGNLEVVGLDTHCCGRNIWELRNTGMDITPKESLPTSRVFIFKNNTDGSGMLPIHIINADILPSFLDDDVVSMQMCAFPLDIYYYADEDDYTKNQPKSKNGKQWLLADGALMPVSFLHNHQIRDENDDVDYSTDDHVLFKGTVKRLEPGIFEIDEDKQSQTYIRCVIDTPYGELHFAHTAKSPRLKLCLKGKMPEYQHVQKFSLHFLQTFLHMLWSIIRKRKSKTILIMYPNSRLSLKTEFLLIF